MARKRKMTQGEINYADLNAKRQLLKYYASIEAPDKKEYDSLLRFAKENVDQNHRLKAKHKKAMTKLRDDYKQLEQKLNDLDECVLDKADAMRYRAMAQEMWYNGKENISKLKRQNTKIELLEKRLREVCQENAKLKEK